MPIDKNISWSTKNCQSESSFKRGDTAQLNNYRPISLLTTISKVFERVFYSQLYAYFNDNNLMSDQ